MKLCDIAQWYTSLGGGITTYIDEKRKYIQEQTDCEHVLIIPAVKDNVQKNGRLSTYYVAAPRIPGNEFYRFIVRLDKIYSILRKEKPDVVEIDSIYFLPWVVFMFRYFNHCKIVGYYHADILDVYVEPFVSKLLGKYWGNYITKMASHYLRFMHNNCDSTVSASRMFYKKLIESGIIQVSMIPLGIDSRIFHPQKRDQSLRKKYGIGEDDLLLIYAGRFDYEKKIDVIVEAFKKLPKSLKCHVMFIGDGPLKTYLQVEEALYEGIYVIPFQQDKNELARYLASADIYVTAGPHETFGLSIIEAQACGLPVVGVKSGALIERVPQTVGILGAINSIDEMAVNIQHLIESNFREKGYKARQIVEKNYSWESTFNKMIIFYQNALINQGKVILQTTVNPVKI